MAREIDLCPYRLPVGTESGLGAADCVLLRRLTGVEDGQLCRVGRDACAACCAGSEPSEARLTPTLASLLYEATGRILDRGGVAGCDATRAARLRLQAEEKLFWGGTVPEPDPVTALGAPGARRPGARPARVGLIGWNTPSGLGTLNRDLARHLPIARWLVPVHPAFRELPGPVGCPVWRGTGPDDLRRFLDGLDWLLFCEHPYLPQIVTLAREMGVRIAFVPMWEYVDEWSPWVRAADLLIAPTRHCRERLDGWREQFGLRCEVALVPWPVDTRRFVFRRRGACRRFVFVNGACGADGRKGLGLLIEAARRAPTVPIVVRTQVAVPRPLPPNVAVRLGDPDDASTLYDEGDVCVQPSRWEGIGLALLECQAVGLPLIATDAPPMNEYRPLRALAARRRDAWLSADRAIDAHEVDPAHLAEVLRQVHGTDVSAASLAARRFIESSHSWAVARPRFLELLDMAAADAPEPRAPSS